jgi:hypothetical protein
MTQAKTYIAIHWSPFRTNILDAGDYELGLPDGTPAKLRRDGYLNFVLTVNGERYETKDNLEMSYTMNRLEVGQLR